MGNSAPSEAKGAEGQADDRNLGDPVKPKERVYRKGGRRTKEGRGAPRGGRESEQGGAWGRGAGDKEDEVCAGTRWAACGSELGHTHSEAKGPRETRAILVMREADNTGRPRPPERAQ